MPRAALFGLVGTVAFLTVAFHAYVLVTVPGTLGLDLPAYYAAAERLLATGSPYSAELHAGPLEHLVVNIPVNYVYPPPLAQLFVPLSVIPVEAMGFMWAASQAVLLAVVLLAIDRRNQGSTDPARAFLIVLATAALHPVLVGLYIGGVSGWVAILVALILLVRPGLRGVPAAAAAWLKVIPGALAVGSLLDPSSRRSTLYAGFGIVLVSLALSPFAWRDFLTVLPNLVGMPPAETHANYAPSYVLATAGLDGPARVAMLVLPAAFLVLTAVNAVRGRTLAWVAAAVGAYLTVTQTSWQQYFIVLVPIAVAVWPDASARLRALIGVGWLWYSVLWYASDQLWHPLAGMVLWLSFLFWVSLRPSPEGSRLSLRFPHPSFAGASARR